jgi:hypothetical protein
MDAPLSVFVLPQAAHCFPNHAFPIQPCFEAAATYKNRKDPLAFAYVNGFGAQQRLNLPLIFKIDSFRHSLNIL